MIASILFVLAMVLVLYLLHGAAMYLFIRLSPPLDCEFLEGKDKVLLISVFQH